MGTSRKFGWHNGALACRSVTVDDSLTINGSMTFGDASTDSLTVNGTATFAEGATFSDALDFTGMTPSGTAGPVLLCGTSATPISTSTADTKFFQIYVDNDATSGDNRAMYLREYLSGAGGSGEALRVFTTVNDVAAGTAHGVHLSLNFASTGSVTGLGVAARCTLHVPNAALSAGTHSAIQAEIYADGSSSDISGATQYSFLRVVADGDATGKANVDANVNFIEFVGVTAASGTMINTDITSHTAYGGLPVVIPGVGVRYVALVSD